MTILLQANGIDNNGTPGGSASVQIGGQPSVLGGTFDSSIIDNAYAMGSESIFCHDSFAGSASTNLVGHSPDVNPSSLVWVAAFATGWQINTGGFNFPIPVCSCVTPGPSMSDNAALIGSSGSLADGDGSIALFLNPNNAASSAFFGLAFNCANDPTQLWYVILRGLTGTIELWSTYGGRRLVVESSTYSITNLGWKYGLRVIAQGDRVRVFLLGINTLNAIIYNWVKVIDITIPNRPGKSNLLWGPYFYSQFAGVSSAGYWGDFLLSRLPPGRFYGDIWDVGKPNGTISATFQVCVAGISDIQVFFNSDGSSAWYIGITTPTAIGAGDGQVGLFNQDGFFVLGFTGAVAASAVYNLSATVNDDSVSLTINGTTFYPFVVVNRPLKTDTGVGLLIDNDDCGSTVSNIKFTDITVPPASNSLVGYWSPTMMQGNWRY